MKSSSRMHSSKEKKEKGSGHVLLDSPEASHQVTDANIVKAIEPLCTELQATKVEKCKTIKSRIEQVTSTIRGEISALKTETQSAIQVLKTLCDQQGAAILKLERTATLSSEALTEVQAEVKCLRAEVNQLAVKCMDLEGRSRRQNIWIAMLREGSENGTEINTFVSRLLKDMLDDASLVD